MPGGLALQSSRRYRKLIGCETPKAIQPILQMMERLSSKNLRHAGLSPSVGYSNRAVAESATLAATTASSKRCSVSFLIASVTWVPTLIAALRSHGPCISKDVTEDRNVRGRTAA